MIGENFELFQNQNKSYREIANQFRIVKRAPASKLNDCERLRQEFEFFNGNCKINTA